jgi:hypothetical protein
MSKSAACPNGRHFHVVGTDVFERDDFTHVIEASDPNSALALVITTVADDWEGANAPLNQLLQVVVEV